MKKPNVKYRVLFSVLICTLMLTTFTFAEPQKESASDDVWTKLEASFYYQTLQTGRSAVTIDDEYKVIDGDAVVLPERLIQQCYTATENEDDLLALCDIIDNGGTLGEQLKNSEEFYTITKDPDGKDSGEAFLELSPDDKVLNVVAFGEITEYSRQDLRLTDALKEKLMSTELDLSQTTARYCSINSFSVGALFSDGKNEYYMPTAETFQSLTLLSLGELYTPAELSKMIQENIDTIFPVREVDENGNPAAGGGVAATESKESNPVDAAEIISPASGTTATAAPDKAGPNLILIVFIILIGTALLSFGLVLINKRKRMR